jgi:DNA-directed RNA polymerase specialized sigma24 family protein
MNMALTEKEYNDLYKYSLNVAYKYVGYKDSAYDIAQNAILSFISSKATVNSPYSWLRTTVKREAFKYINEEKKATQIIPQKAKEIPITSLNLDDESDDVFKLSSQKIKTFLSTSDYEWFLKLKKCDFSIKKCAEKEKTSVGTVKTIKRRVKRSIISTYLYENGWRSGTKLLNYNQYLTINRCIIQIIDSVKKKEMSELRNYLRKVDNVQLNEIFEGVDACLEWSVVLMEDYFKVILVCTPINPIPILIEMHVKFNKTSYLYIIEARAKKPILIINSDGEELQKYKVKGKLNLTLDQIVSILNNKQTDI